MRILSGVMLSGTISYIYTATGIKLKKIVSTGTTTSYAGNYVYENDALQFFNQPEGYVEPTGDVNKPFQYVYQYKDHLGNIRLSYKDVSLTSTPSLQIVEENNYYPFGLKHKGYNNVQNGRDHKFGFGNKEEQDELGLSWIDITARNYDPALGRWMNVDPLAEKSRRFSPYTYALNNPVFFIDPDGMMPGPGDEILKKALLNPDVQKHAAAATSSAKQIVSGSIEIKPKLGIGVSTKANIGSLNAKVDANVITANATVKSSGNQVKVGVEAKVLSGSAEIGFNGGKAKVSGTMAKGSIEATITEGNVSVNDASAKGSTGDVSYTDSNGNNATVKSSGDFTVGAETKVYKAISVSASVNLTKFGETVVSSFKAFGSFVKALGTETVNAALQATQKQNY